MSDPDRFRGAASWSGTSFAAPLVAGKIARLVREQQLLPKQAVRRLLDGPDLARLPYLGTIVTD
jgi:subtilase family serine protease